MRRGEVVPLLLEVTLVREKKVKLTLRARSIALAHRRVVLRAGLVVPDQVVAGGLVEELDQTGLGVELHDRAHGHVGEQVHGGDDHDDLVVAAAGVDVVLAAHHLADLDLALQLAFADGDVLGTDAGHDVAGLLAVLLQGLLLEGV